MGSKLLHCRRSEVVQENPAIFADNMMMLITDAYDIPWKIKFTTEECHEKFFITSGTNILRAIEDIICPWYEDRKVYPNMWLENEELLSKYLYLLKKTFYEKSDKDAKAHFPFYCATMIYIALVFYKKGVKSALTMVFLEVYFLACYYTKLMNFKCDLVSISF